MIVNPMASSVTARARIPIADALAEEHDLEVVETSERDDATRLARDAAEQGVDVVVVLAGDGTLNETARGLIGSETAMFALPGGSTNVFARTLGVAHEPARATRQLLRSLAARAFRRVGLGVATPPGGEDRPFLFHLGTGFDAAVVAEMEQRSYLKRYVAHPAFALATVDTWLRHYDRRAQLCAAGDQGVLGVGPYVVVSNSDPYTYVLRRPLTIAPRAALDESGLAVTVLHNLRASLMLRAALSGLTDARFLERSPEISQHTGVDHLVITGDRPFPWQVDGDHLGAVPRLAVRYEPDALTLVVP